MLISWQNKMVSAQVAIFKSQVPHKSHLPPVWNLYFYLSKDEEFSGTAKVLGDSWISVTHQ